MAKKKQKANQNPTAKVGKRQASLVVPPQEPQPTTPDAGVEDGGAAARARVAKLETDRSRVATNQLEKVIKNLEYAASETAAFAPETQGTSAALIADAKDLLQRMRAYWIAVLHTLRGSETGA